MSGDRAGRCGDASPTIAGGVPQFCELRAGHAGWHEEGNAGWTASDPMTASDADRAKAAEVAGADDLRVATEVIGAWMTTGSVPKAAAPIADALAAERAAAVADLRTRVEALVEELATLPGLREREYVAARLRAIADDQPVQP